MSQLINCKFMNKSTNIFRKCPYCPHHNTQTKCCCQKQKSRIPSKRAKSIKTKNTLQGEIQNMSSIDFANNNLKTNNNNSRLNGNDYNNFHYNYNQINIPTLIAQNTILKSQNGNLKKQLLNVSCFNPYVQEKPQQYNSYQKQQNLSTLNSCNKYSTQQQNLMDKLYHSNRNLQQAIIKIESLSKANHQLNEQNMWLNKKLQKLELDIQQYQVQISRLNRCSKKNNNQIQEKCKYLEESNLQLKRELQKEKIKSRKIQGHDQITLSPQWVAETTSKVKMIEKGLNKLQQTENINTNADEEDINNLSQTNRIKQELFVSISNAQSQVKKFHSSLLVEISQKADIMTLVKILIQNIIQSVVNSQVNVQSEFVRKVSLFQKKIDFLMGKLQNLVLCIRNRQLRKRSTSRSRISGKRNILSKQNNTFSRNSIASKENFNSSNSVNLLANRPKSQFNY